MKCVISTSSGEDSSQIILIAASTSWLAISCPILRLLNTPTTNSYLFVFWSFSAVFWSHYMQMEILCQLFYFRTNLSQMLSGRARKLVYSVALILHSIRKLCPVRYPVSGTLKTLYDVCVDYRVCVLVSVIIGIVIFVFTLQIN